MPNHMKLLRSVFFVAPVRDLTMCECALQDMRVLPFLVPGKLHNTKK